MADRTGGEQIHGEWEEAVDWTPVVLMGVQAAAIFLDR